MTMLRLYRGIAVPASSAARASAAIRRDGLTEGQGRFGVKHLWSLPAGVSVEEAYLSSAATRNAEWCYAVCACGTLEGAAYYAWQHNRHGADDTPILIEFEAHLDQVRIDGRDFLYSAFQMGDPERARGVLENIFGSRILRYVDAAWATNDREERVALCDLATLDPDVVLAHYANRTVIGGRYGTTFESAFTVAYPVPPTAIVRVWTPQSMGAKRIPSVSIGDILPSRPPRKAESRQQGEVEPTVSIFDIWKFKHED